MLNFKDLLVEGTAATITVKDGNIYKTSILQYDGYPNFMRPELKKYWKTAEKAKELATGTGELRGVSNGEAEYYDSRKLLMVTKNEDQAFDNMNSTYYKYYFDGKKWYWGESNIYEFTDLQPV